MNRGVATYGLSVSVIRWFLILSACGPGIVNAQQQRPNIVFIFSDDHACRATGCYGSPLIKTPHIDRLAKEGMRFDRCYVTNSICGPSRACVLTGKYSHANGYYRNDQELDASIATFPQLLQSGGYQTALIGKWHLGRRSRPQGFDHWRILDHQGYYYQPKMIDRFGLTQHVGYVSDIVTDLTIQWLEKGRDPDRPFLLMMQHKAPHRPWDPAPRYLSRFMDRSFEEPTTLFDDFANRSKAARMAEMSIAQHLSTTGPDLKAWDQDSDSQPLPPAHRRAREWFYNKMTHDQLQNWKRVYSKKNAAFYDGELSGDALVRWKYQRFMQDYLACVSSLDDSVGAILDYLDQNGLRENTVVVYSSDQGFFLGEHGWFDKRFMYEPSLRTPLVIRWPEKVKPGSVEKRIVSNVDFAQTFLEIAGLSASSDAYGMQGRSLVPILAGEQISSWRRSFYYHYYEGLDGPHRVSAHEGVTDGKLKLIHYYPLDEWELFDLVADPHEVTNVFEQDRYSQQKSKMLAELQRQKERLRVSATAVPSR